MKTVTVSEAESRLGQIIDEVLNGQPVVVVRGKQRVLLRACGSAAQEKEWAEFCAAFPPAPAEPARAQARIRKIIKRVRRNA